MYIYISNIDIYIYIHQGCRLYHIALMNINYVDCILIAYARTMVRAQAHAPHVLGPLSPSPWPLCGPPWAHLQSPRPRGPHTWGEAWARAWLIAWA